MDDLRTRAPLARVVAGLGLAGAAKLASAEFAEKNFATWGYPVPVRGRGDRGLRGGGCRFGDPLAQARPVAAIGTLCSMAGFRPPISAPETWPGLSAPKVLAVCGVAVLAAQEVTEMIAFAVGGSGGRPSRKINPQAPGRGADR